MSQASMVEAVMGDAFPRLASPVRRFHGFDGHQVFHGEVKVRAPASFLAQALAFALGAPLKAVEGPIRFELQAAPDSETWTRFFPGKTMRSTLTKDGGRMVERLGASRLTFALLAVKGALEMRLEQLHFWGIPCPGWLMPKVVARETGRAQTLCFKIQASVPGIGLVASYEGHLDMPAVDAP